MRIFDFDHYKDYVRAYVKELPHHGRGQYLKIARHLKVHTTYVSQVFRGPKELSLEQALALTEYLGLTELETEFFLALVQREKSGTQALKKRFQKQISTLKERSLQVTHRIPKSIQLTQADQALFYSSWYYSAVRLLTSIPGYDTSSKIAERLGLPQKLVGQVSEFLLSKGLCIEPQAGRLAMGTSRTQIGADSPLIARHHANWRIKAMEKLGKVPASSQEELMFTSPLTLSHKQVSEVRELLLRTIEEISKRVEKEEPERFFFLNLDWLEGC